MNGGEKMNEELIEFTEEELVEEIEIEEIAGWTSGEEILHHNLSGRDEPEQHPIEAITGLREELDKIESIGTVYSNKVNVANYYEWADGAKDDFGHFVTLVDHSSKIKICDGLNIFGVTVKFAAFIGNQSTVTPRDNSYGLVVTSGIVDVMCESDVVEGDYVVSNDIGLARRTDSDCGYKVVAIEKVHGINYATISLGVQACTVDKMGHTLQYLSDRMDDAEINIAAAIKLANEASAMAGGTSESNQGLSDKVDGALDTVDDMATKVEDLGGQVSNATIVAAQAKAIAEGAVTSAESMCKEAVDAANGALDKAGEIEKTVEPITTWKYEDPDTGITNEGATYFVEYMENGLATKAEMETVTRLDEENKLLITKNAENFQQMLSSVDKYCIGEYSQAYGLTLKQARNILIDGMVYIPTKHGEEDTHIEKYADGENVLEREFTYGYYYMWSLLSDGEYMWSERLGEVWFNKEQPTGSAYTYWYDGSRLHILTDGEWIEIATLAGNVNNRITSMIRQDVDSVTTEIVNAYGSVAGFGAQLSDTTAKANMAATWILENDPSAGDSTIRNVAAVDISADKDGSQMALVVSQKDGNKTVKGASIVMDQNGTDSHITISADNIVMDGTTTFITSGDLSGEKTTENKTIIHGSHITTGNIASSNYTDDNETVYSDAGTQINLDDGSITSPNFAITSDGDVHFQGSVIAKEGEIAGWDISDQGLTKADANIEIGLSPGNGGTYNDGLDNLGLVLYAGTKAPREPKTIAGTWRFTEASDDIKDFLRDAYLDGSVEFDFYGWFNHPTSGWTKYEGQSARLTFVYSGDEAFEITLSVDGSNAQMLWGCGSYNAVPWTSDMISERLLNREIGFGAEGIDDVWIGDYQFGTNILSSIATFIPGSIGMYPAMLDKDGRLYAQEVRLGGSADSVVEVGRCAVGNIIINNDAMVYKKGWDQAGGFYLGKDGLTVGENFRVQSQGVSTSSVVVGVAVSTHTEGTVACKILRATQEIIGTVSTSSDRNKKNSIEELDERYDEFFDTLEPQRFKYNNGTSDRYHLGYITQDVQEGLVQAGLTEQEFAGVITRDVGTDAEESYLRYNEFVSLNTDQIQKLKKRVDALEAKNAELEERLAKLEALLINNAE